MSDSEDSSSSEVTWQVAWFALLALGLTAMTQPCGNVLCLKAKNQRFYIRASPIVCVADVLQFILFILLGFSSTSKVWLHNIKFELKERFDGESGARDLQASEHSILTRWILMILGGSQFQVIKLMSMEGIPWTQAWAMMFFISIIFGEILILLARTVSLEDSANTPPLWRSYNVFGSLDYKVSDVLDNIAIIPISLQFALCYVVCFAFQTWLIFKIGYLFEDPKMTWTACIILFYTLYFSPILFEVATMVRKKIWPRPPADGSSPALLRMDSSKQRIFSLGCPVFISFLLFTPYVRDQDVFRPALTLWIWIYISFAFCWLLFGMAKDSPGPILGSIYRRVFRVDSLRGSQAVSLAFLTFLASIMHYGAMYNSSGTVNPEWTGIFGR